jgi:hypothetical protein
LLGEVIALAEAKAVRATKPTAATLGSMRGLSFGEAVVRLGGCPMAEHGVGRNAVKQELLRRLYGDGGIAQMRAVKAALDPEWRLSPGVLFPRFARPA